MAQTKPPYRAEHVGSLPRPERLMAAREQYGSAKIPKKELPRSYREANHVEFKVSDSGFSCSNTSLDGLRSLSSRFCKCCPLLRAIKRGNGRRTA
jgi:hypothetical protein